MAAQMREDDIVTAFGLTDEPHDTTVVTNWRSPYNTTAFGVADAPQNTAVAKSGQGPYNATASGVTYEQQHTFGNITASQKQPLTPGTWNVRTTNDSSSSIRPERATAIICRECKH